MFLVYEPAYTLKFLETFKRKTRGKVEKWKDLFMLYEVLYRPEKYEEFYEKVTKLSADNQNDDIVTGNTKSFSLS